MTAVPASPCHRWRVLASAVASVSFLAAGSCGDSPAGPSPVPGAVTLTCPAPIVFTGVQPPGRVIVYPKPVVAGAVAPVVSSCSPAQGSTFLLGTTTVTCTTTDALSRRVSCSFPVSLSRSVLGATRFLAFGDSITRGEDGIAANYWISVIDPNTAYPTVLQQLLAADFPGQGITVTNSGKPGEPVSCTPPPGDTCGVERLAVELAMQRPQVLLLLHGYNDLGDPAAVSRVVTALRDSVRLARAAGVTYVFVGTITPGRTPTGPFRRQRDPQAIIAANAGIVTMAAAEGAHLVDAYAAFLGRELQLVNIDGLHLTAAGFRVLAETFYARVRQVIPTSEQ